MRRGHVVSLGSVQEADVVGRSVRREKGIDLAVAHQAPNILEDEDQTAQSVQRGLTERPEHAMDALLFQRLELQRRRELYDRLTQPQPPQYIAIAPPAPATTAPPTHDREYEERETRLEKTARRMQELQMIMGMFSPFGMGGMYGIDGTVVFGLMGGVLLLTVAGGMAAYALTRRNRAPVRRIRLSLARSSTSSSTWSSSSSSSYSY